MNIDKLLIIIILIIIIFIILIHQNNKYENLEEVNNKTTTIDALNNIIDLINDDKIKSKNLEITEKSNINELISKKSTIDNIKSKKIDIDDININNNLTIKNTKIYIGDITINYSHNWTDSKITTFGILYINNNECILNNCTILIHTTVDSPFYIINISDGTNTYYPYTPSDYRGGGFVNIGHPHQLNYGYFTGLLACDNNKRYKILLHFEWNKYDENFFKSREWYYLSFNDVRFKLKQ